MSKCRVLVGLAACLPIVGRPNPAVADRAGEGLRVAEQKKKLLARDVVADIRAGASDEFLMRKYGMSEKGLQSLFQKLVTARALTQADLDDRESAVEEVEATIIEEAEIEEDELKSVSTKFVQTVFKCPACGQPQLHEFKECPDCGCPVERYLKCKEKEAEIERQRLDEDRENEARKWEKRELERARREAELQEQEQQRTEDVRGAKESNDDLPRCPNCGSRSIATVKKGYSAGTGCCGAILLGPLGLLCGAAKSNQLHNVCQKCGHKWLIRA